MKESVYHTSITHTPLLISCCTVLAGSLCVSLYYGSKNVKEILSSRKNCWKKCQNDKEPQAIEETSKEQDYEKGGEE